MQERDALIAVIDPEQRGADAFREQQAAAPPMRAPSMWVTAVLRVTCHSNPDRQRRKDDTEGEVQTQDRILERPQA